MPKFKVRIDACFTYDVEADCADDAQAAAESRFENEDYEENRVTETLVFKEDGVTIADDDDDDDDDDDLCGQCHDPRCDGCTPLDTPTLDDSFHRGEMDV